MTGVRVKTTISRPTLAAVKLLPLAPGIASDPTTSELTEPYCVLSQDDNGSVAAMVYTLEKGVTLTRTYWPGHADVRWPPTRLATSPQQARWLLAERPMQMVAVPESVVQQMYRGWNLALTDWNPQ